jgi:hypothetical protein
VQPSTKWQGFRLTGKAGACKTRKLSKVNVINCADCVKNSCTDRELEDRWVQLCMSRLHRDPRCHLPESIYLSSKENSRLLGSFVKEGNDVSLNGVSFKNETIADDKVDLPALMLAAHLLQQSGYLLSYVPLPSLSSIQHSIASEIVPSSWTSILCLLIFT